MQTPLLAHSEAQKTRHAPALSWCARLALPHHLVWMEPSWFRASIALMLPETEQTTAQAARTLSRRADHAAACVALHALFPAAPFPSEHTERDLLWRSDALGKPGLVWQGDLAEWARRQGWDDRHLHVSNTHDGDAHLVLTAYEPNLAGIGIDVVHLPRLRRPGKDRSYLLRFARQFMAEAEWDAFTAAATDDEEEEALRLRVAAHFSLMEALSKACGTGLNLGVGLGRKTALSRFSLGVLRLAPEVGFTFGPEAQTRLAALGATRGEGFWGTDGEYLVSAALLWRE